MDDKGTTERLAVLPQSAFEPEVGFRVLVVGGDFAIAGGAVEADGRGEVVGGVEADRAAAVFDRDLVEAGEDAAAEPAAPIRRRYVHALHLGHLGVEMADTAKTGRLAVDAGEQQHPVRRHQVGGRSRRDLLVEVDPRALTVIDKRPIGLMDEVRVQASHLRIVSINRLQDGGHGIDANGLQNFSNLRATRALRPGTIPHVNQKELSEVIAEAAAKTEAAAARTEAAVAGAQEARVRQEAATARWEATQADAAERNKMLDGLLAKQDVTIAEMKAMTVEMRADRKRSEERDEAHRAEVQAQLEAYKAESEARREEDRSWRQEALRRQDKMFHDYLQRADRTLAEMKQQTADIKAELRDQHDERRAFREAILKLIDRLPPPPPHLRSA